MPLDDYAKKREFSKTPEPPPAAGEFEPARRFCVQRHAARRLHYDLRMEIGGTLKSWAVPQGPTLDPAAKRLAVMVEDHPVEYAIFEGNIPKGNYGAGSMMLWDAGTFDVLPDKSGDDSPESQLAKGDFKFRLIGTKLRGNFALVRLKNSKGNEWLLLKKKDEESRDGWDIEQHAWSVLSGRTQEEIALDMPHHAPNVQPRQIPGAVAAPMPSGIEAMLAQPDTAVPQGPDWLFEIKWDGVRAFCHIDRNSLRLVGRKGTAMDRQYPELHAIPAYLDAETAILDGEIAVIDEAGRPSFARIQPRIMASDAGAIAQLARSRPAIYFVFDILYWNGQDLRSTPLRERKRVLRSILKPGCPHLKLSEHFEGNGTQLLEAARAQGLEGVVAKRASSSYQPGRVRDWRKIKITQEQEFVICGYTDGERDFFGALVLGAFDDGRLVWVGNVGTGFDRKLMHAIQERLTPLETRNRAFAEQPAIPQTIHWVKPELVCTARYHSFTEENRLRAPVFVGLRPDIDASECTLLTGATPSAQAPLLSRTNDEAVLEIDGQRLKFKNLNKVFYPKEGYTKRDILNYYDAVASLLIPYWRDRPLSLRRYPDGIEGEGFFQKNAEGPGFPDWLRKGVVREEDGTERLQIVGGGKAELLFLANYGCIDQNPWMSRLESIGNPDFILIDLDPHECGYDRIVEAAQLVRSRLEQLGLDGYPKTTGGDGMHIYIPVEAVYTYKQTRAFAEILARLLAAEHPGVFTTPRAVSQRDKGKVYFDYLQNGQGKTISAPYVLRAYPGAPVATPLAWEEVRPGLRPRQFNITNSLARFDRTGDLFEGVLNRPQRLEAAIVKLDSMIAAKRR